MPTSASTCQAGPVVARQCPRLVCVLHCLRGRQNPALTLRRTSFSEQLHCLCPAKTPHLAVRAPLPSWWPGHRLSLSSFVADKTPPFLVVLSRGAVRDRGEDAQPGRHAVVRHCLVLCSHCLFLVSSLPFLVFPLPFHLARQAVVRHTTALPLTFPPPFHRPFLAL